MDDVSSVDRVVEGVWSEMQLARRKVALVFDNFPAHPVMANPTKVEMVCLPPGTTSKTQPCDQGIIQVPKHHYRNHLLCKFLDCIDKKEELCPHVLDAMTIIRRAWSEVSATTIANCFGHCGFKTTASNVPAATYTESSTEEQNTEDEADTLVDASVRAGFERVLPASTNVDSVLFE